jgi:hypothetical protein
MANKKRRCTYCKKYKEAEKGIIAPIGFFCDKECQYGYATKKPKELKQKTDKRLDDEFKVRQREYNSNKLSTRKRATKEACHEYIRLRDKDDLCICCSEPLGDDFEAGHFWESGNFSFIRYHEDNIHGQRKHCNMFKGGDSGFYRENLINKIGVDRVNWLDDNRSKSVKMTADDYREIEAYYKAKIKEL